MDVGQGIPASARALPARLPNNDKSVICPGVLLKPVQHPDIRSSSRSKSSRLAMTTGGGCPSVAECTSWGVGAMMPA